MGTIKTTNIEPIANNGTVTLGSSGDQFTLATGAKSSFLYPAFEAYLGGSGGQAVSDNTVTLVQANTEVYDTDSAYNTSTYRFTPQVSGKYLVYGSVLAETGSSSNLNENYLYVKKNGNIVTGYENNFASNPVRINLIQVNAVVDMNGSSDYLELYGRINSVSGSGQLFESDSQYKRATAFGAYRIGA